jgi:hypothetical protein
MNRALSLSCVALLAVGVTGSSAFADKPKVAILGIEVVDNGGGIDKGSTDFARDLTAALRDRPQAANGGPFSLAPNSKKELIDEKLLKSCTSDTDYPCIASIGADIDKEHGGTQFLIYGNLEKRTQAGKKGYLVNLRILNVASKQPEQTWTQFIPQDQTGSAEKWAKAAYQKLIPSSGNSGGLVIKIDNEGVDKGTVIIDGNPAGSLRSGQFKANSLSEGKHRIEIEVGGFKRFSREVTVVAGESKPENFTLEVECSGPGCGPTQKCDPSVDNRCGIEGTVSDRGSRGWKIATGGGVVATAVLATGFFVYWGKLKETGPGFVTNGSGQLLGQNGMVIDKADTNNPPVQQSGTLPSYGGYCQKAPGTNNFNDNIINEKGESKPLPGACHRGDYWQTMTYATGIGAVVALGFTGWFAYKGFVSKTERPPAGGTTGRRSKPPRNLVVTPVLSPDGAGATLRLDW